MTELEKFNLLLRGGYNPMGGAITTNQMEDFKTAGLFNQIQDTNNLISSLNIPNNPNPVPNTADEDLLKRQKRGNMLIAFGDLLRGKDATAGFTQRQAMFDAERELAERKAKQEQRLKDQEEFIKNNPQFEQMIRFNQLFDMDMPQPKNSRIIKGADGFNYYADTGERVLPGVVQEKKQSDRKYEKAADGFYRYVDDGTKVFGGIEVPKQGFEITTTDILGAQKDERKTFEATNKGVKNFQQLLDAAQAADGAASYALMIKFIKQLDDSVVREGEVATFGGFQGALTNLKNQISKTSGEGFTPKVKANMINLAAQTANRLVNDYNIYKAGKEASYDAIGFDPNMIFAGLDFNLGDLDLSRQYTPNDFEFIEYE